jgi:hypothetical protein
MESRSLNLKYSLSNDMKRLALSMCAAICVSLLSTLIAAEVEDGEFYNSVWIEAFRSAHHPRAEWADQWKAIRTKKPYMEFILSAQNARKEWGSNDKRSAFLHFEIMECGSIGAVHTVGYISLAKSDMSIVRISPYAGAKPVQKRLQKDSKVASTLKDIQRALKNCAEYEFSTINAYGGYLFVRIVAFDKDSTTKVFVGGKVGSDSGNKAEKLLTLLQKTEGVSAYY